MSDLSPDGEKLYQSLSQLQGCELGKTLAEVPTVEERYHVMNEVFQALAERNSDGKTPDMHMTGYIYAHVLIDEEFPGKSEAVAQIPNDRLQLSISTRDDKTMLYSEKVQSNSTRPPKYDCIDVPPPKP